MNAIHPRFGGHGNKPGANKKGAGGLIPAPYALPPQAFSSETGLNSR